MLFWLVLIIFIIGIILWRVGENLCFNFDDECSFIGVSISAIFGIILIIMLIILSSNYLLMNNACKIRNEELYKSLIYKTQTESIRDDFGIINKEYIDEIQEWNMDVITYKELQRNFWVGIFYPNIFDDFETIDLSTIKMKGELK